MRNNQNLHNRQISSNNVNGRQLPSISSVYSIHRSRTPNRNTRYPSNQSNRTYNNNDSTYSNRPYSNNRSYSNHRSLVIIDHKTYMITITETDHRVITETIITETNQITGIVVTATTEIPTVQFQIIVITKDTTHDHHINIHDHRTSPDHHIREIENLIAIMEVDITATIEIEDQIIKTTDKVIITETEIIINHIIEKTEI